MMRARLETSLLALLLASLIFASACTNSETDNGVRLEQPDVILINIDDADLDLIGQEPIAEHFPNLNRYLQTAGMRFDQFHVADPLCGPSRASMFRGQYIHNTGIELNSAGDGNGGPVGSWGEFLDRGYTQEEIGSWMQRGGYHTALVGKYHHTEFPTAAGNLEFVPPGWNDFRASGGGGYFDFARFVNGVVSRNDRSEFRTDVERREVIDILTNRDSQTPLFLYVAPFAPHGSPTGEIYAPRHADLFADVQVPRTPDFNEADITDKPASYQPLPLLNEDQIEQHDRSFRNRLRSMMAVDEMVGEIFETLKAEGTIGNTYVLFTSDNGFQLGQHRMSAKKDAFDRTTRVGMLVVGPGIAPASSSNALLSSIDIAPTILELAGIETPSVIDGRSFASLLRGEELPDRDAGILIENKEPKTTATTVLALDYVALRMGSEVYVEHASGEREYYDLATDPYQLENSYDSLTRAKREDLEQRVEQLRSCRGASCSGGVVPGVVDTVITEASYDDDTLRFRGTAEATSGVDTIRVTIRSTTDNRYWNGETLADRFASVSVDLNNDASWSYDAIMPADTYWVSAAAIDTEGNPDPRLDAIIVRGSPPLDPAPIAAIATESGSSVPSGDVVFVGSVDPVPGRALEDVLVRVARIDNDFATYWSGTAWVDEVNTWARSDLTGTDWSFVVTLEPGRYRVVAYASDGSGAQTWDHGRPEIEINVG